MQFKAYVNLSPPLLWPLMIMLYKCLCFFSRGSLLTHLRNVINTFYDNIIKPVHDNVIKPTLDGVKKGIEIVETPLKFIGSTSKDAYWQQ